MKNECNDSKVKLINFLITESILVLLMLSIGFLVGTYLQIYNHKPKIQQIPEINSYVPVIQIDKLTDSHIKGIIKGGQVRIKHNSEIYILQDGEEFEI